MRQPLLVLLLLFASGASAQGQDLRLTGQLRPRFEQRDPLFPAAPLGDVTMRARVGVAGALPDNVALRLEVQDVLIWGGTAATPGVSTATEVHQAYVDIGVPAAGVTARLGRQEVAIGNQRLVSNNNWGQRGRRFDGARLVRRGTGLPGNLVALRIAESGTGTGADAWFHGLHAALSLRPGDTLHVYGLYNRERGTSRTDQYTAGGHGTITVAGIGLGAEGYLQRGTRADGDVTASMISVGVESVVGRLRARAAWDHYSGDANPTDGDARAFDRLFGSNHAYHGYADLFTNIPAATGQRGLRDLSLRTTTRLDARSDLEVNGHVFRAVVAPTDQSTRFGEEIDIVLRHRLRAPVTVEGGASWFRTGSALTTVRGIQRDLAFGYVMATVQF